MVTPSVGSVVLVRFPFSDLSNSKQRPAVVLAESGKGDWVLCQVTSKSYSDSRAIELNNHSFVKGSLHTISYVRPGKLFTANQNLIIKQVGTLKDDAFRQVIAAVVELLSKGH